MLLVAFPSLGHQNTKQHLQPNKCSVNSCIPRPLPQGRSSKTLKAMANPRVCLSMFRKTKEVGLCRKDAEL